MLVHIQYRAANGVVKLEFTACLPRTMQLLLNYAMNSFISANLKLKTELNKVEQREQELITLNTFQIPLE